MRILLALLLAAPVAAAHAQETIAITDVTVIPMDRDTALPGQTVLLRDGRIDWMGPAERAPAGAARRVDGRGRFLVPGLMDMHAHLLSDAEVPDSLAGEELAVMLANGVTAARLMIGTPEQLLLRDRVRRGEVSGPLLTVGSPQISGRAFGGDHFNGVVATTPEAARQAVRDAAAAGYDFIKLTFFISRPVYDAAVDEARARRLRVVGHVDRQVGLARALEAGQQIEHLDGYLEAILADSAPSRGSVSGVYVWQAAAWSSLDHVDHRKIDSVARATAAAGVWSTPTLTFLRLAFGTGQADEEIRARPDWRIIPAARRAEMAGPRDQFWATPPSAERRARWVDARNRLTRAIHAAGGRILAGSDAPEWFLMTGWTLHRELESLVGAGLTPFDALEAATRNPAEWLGVEAGVVRPGLRADLVLLEANPLEDIRNTTRIHGVIVGGRYLDRAALDAMLARAEARLGGWTAP